MAERKNGLKGVRTIEALELLSNTRAEGEREREKERKRGKRIQSSESDFNKQTVKRNLCPGAY